MQIRIFLAINVFKNGSEFRSEITFPQRQFVKKRAKTGRYKVGKVIVVSSDPSRKLVRADMSGFLYPVDVRQFNADKEAAVVEMGLKSGEFSTLVNTVDCVIQSQVVVAEFTQAVLTSRYQSRRLAVVRRNSLTRLQTRRIISVRDNACMFESEAEAMDWLFGPDNA